MTTSKLQKFKINDYSLFNSIEQMNDTDIYGKISEPDPNVIIGQVFVTAGQSLLFNSIEYRATCISKDEFDEILEERELYEIE